MAKVSTTYSQTAWVHLPYRYRCAYCGKSHTFDKAFSVTESATVYGCGSTGTASMMQNRLSKGLPKSVQDSINNRVTSLKEYRETLVSGRLEQYLRTGKKEKGVNSLYFLPESYFGEPCPDCPGKKQPWLMDPAGDGPAAAAAGSGIGIAVSVLILGMTIVCLTGAAERFGLLPGPWSTVVFLLAAAAGIGGAIPVYRAAAKKRREKILKMNIKAEDLPVLFPDQLRIGRLP